MNIPIFSLLLLIVNSIYCQGLFLYPEHYNNCRFTKFCLDCGEDKAIYNGDLNSYFDNKFNKADLEKIEGLVFVEIFVDTLGRQCVKSIGNRANEIVSKLELHKTINSMTGWKPAIEDGNPVNSSITILFEFYNDTFNVLYQRDDPWWLKEFSPSGQIHIINKKVNSDLLKNEFIVYTTKNSTIPSDITRTVSIDKNNIIWLGADNGISKIKKDTKLVINSNNSALRLKRNELSIMNSTVDLYNNKWFSDGFTTYKLSGNEWNVYDATNSPIKITTGLYADKYGRVWLTSHFGLIKFEKNSWTIMDTSNSELPSNYIIGVFVDSKKRLWVGTDKGNVMFDGLNILRFNSSDCPLKTMAIKKGYEDKTGNIWFSLYENRFPQSIGFIEYTVDGKWISIDTKNSNIPRNDILDFTINEKTNTIWFSINGVGISEFDGKNWATFTKENSNVPGNYIPSIALDKDGNLWCATFAGLLKITPIY